MGDTWPWQSLVWNSWCAHKELHETYRFLTKSTTTFFVNCARPHPVCEHFGCSSRGAERGQLNNRKQMCDVSREHPQTTMLTCTIMDAWELNDICIRAKSPRREPLAIVHADVEANPANYFKSTYKPFEEVRPHLVPLHAGRHIILTRNVRKDVDFVREPQRAKGSWLLCAKCGRHGHLRNPGQRPLRALRTMRKALPRWYRCKERLATQVGFFEEHLNIKLNNNRWTIAADGRRDTRETPGQGALRAERKAPRRRL